MGVSNVDEISNVDDQNFGYSRVCLVLFPLWFPSFVRKKNNDDDNLAVASGQQDFSSSQNGVIAIIAL